MVTSPVTVSVACFGKEVWIRVAGRGNFQGSGSLKKFAQSMILRGYREFLIDLSSCDHMDSTFMGTLTGISQNLRELGQGSLRTVNVSPRNVDLLENLGLNFLFSVEPRGEQLEVPSLAEKQLTDLPTALDPEKEVVMSAHEALAAVSSVNADRFRDVLEYLRQDEGGEAEKN